MSRRTEKSFRSAAKRIDSVRAKIKSRTAKMTALRTIGEEIMADVKASRPGAGVPVDTGALRSTGRVEGPARDEVELSFGGTSAPYALVQHENMDYHHDIGEARYLVRGIERWRKDGASVAKARAEITQALEGVLAERAGRRRDPKTGRFISGG